MTSAFPHSEVKILSVAELSRAVKILLEEGFPTVWVTGELSNVSRPASGHVYFTLKDSEAQIRCALWRTTGRSVRFELRDGLEVILRGRMNVYLPRGEYQLTVEEIQPKGIGPLELAFRQLCEKLRAEGLFDERRKRSLPRFPRRVVLITSPSSAAVRDMLEVLGRRWPLTEIWVSPVPVQGDGAAQAIAAAVAGVNRLQGIDVIIVARGGGSLEDLWAFNEEIVARAIHRSGIPVVCGIGHETDVTIADLVADVRALTPSEAAERVVPNLIEVTAALRGVAAQLRTSLTGRVERARDRIDEFGGRRCFRFPLECVHDAERRLDELDGRLTRAGAQRIEGDRQRLVASAGRLDALSPLNTLARGYSVTRRETDLAIVLAADQVQQGDRLVTLLHNGRIFSHVDATQGPMSNQ
jgi:exodeoxyribonuclease VII large subunit